MSARVSTATIALGTRPRPTLGPELGRRRWPLRSLLLSVIAHVVGLGALTASAVLWSESQPKTYVVNLVPAVAAVGRPQGRVSEPALPPRPSEPTPAPRSRTSPTELPARPSRVASTPLELPTRPEARVPELPERAPAPPRPATLPRPGEKELPTTAAPVTPSAPTVARESAPRRDAVPAPPPPPPPPLGQIAGSMQGAGAVTLSVSDFPYAWYIRAIHNKIQERWEGRAIDGRQPEVIFEIGADGQLRRLTIGKTSGNPAYDQLALRAVSDASPFPPLPAGFGKPTLRVGLQFMYDPRAG